MTIPHGRKRSGLNGFIYALLPFLLLAVLSADGLAVEDEYILYPSIEKKEESVQKEREPMSGEAGPFEWELWASSLAGYDTNVYLTHYDESASIFLQNSLSFHTKSRLFERCLLRLEYDLVAIDYLRFAEPDLSDHIFTAALDMQVTEELLWSVEYAYDFVGFPHDDASEYSVDEITSSLRHDISDRLYQKLAYSFFDKDYGKWKTRTADGNMKLGDREDKRNAVEYELGYYLSDKTLIKSRNSFFRNNSNELYLDYYDYKALSTRASLVHIITDKIYALLDGGYQFKSYDNRVVSDKVSGDQRDHLLMGGASIYYDILKNLSLGTNFDYRKNFSNENGQKYTDYVISCGVYYKY